MRVTGLNAISWVLVVGVVASLGLGCGRSATGLVDDDDTDTEGDDTTESESAESTESGDETAGDEANFLPMESESGVEALTCREMLNCLIECIGGGGGLDCLQTCGQGAEQSEVAAAGQLLFCVSGVCVQNEQCSLQDLATEDCITCLGVGLFLPEPPGCEAEGMACQ